MLEDGVHAVSGLLPRHPQVLLQRSGDAAMRMITMMITMNIMMMMVKVMLPGEDGLGSLVGVQWAGGAWNTKSMLFTLF